MTQKYAGVTDVPLSLGVWLGSDTYDYNNDPKTISATTLLKPIRQIILPPRVPADMALPMLGNMVKNRIGAAIHDAIERSWTENYVEAMKALGYPPGLIKLIKVNPKPEDLKEGDIPVYLEQRLSRQFKGWTVTGKFDFVAEGKVEDFKSTSTYTYMKQVNAIKFSTQGSIYRWLDPKLITQDNMAINYIFTDWMAGYATRTPGYPSKAFLRQEYPLIPLVEMDEYVSQKLRLIETLMDAPEEEIPWCTDEDLWRSDPIFKYYKNSEKRQRSTKNFDNAYEANLRLVEDGNVGVVVEVPGEATACKYCPAFAVCSQKDALIKAGELIIT